MADLNQAAENNPVHFQDWRVWAEIVYLDSPTEYREYLANAPVENSAIRADFILLSGPELSSKKRTWISPVITFLLIVLIAACSLYALAQLF
jgi:hypothetical protein